MKMKRFISALLVLVMVLSMAAPAFAEGDENPVQLTINQFYNDDKDHGKAWLDQAGQMNIPAVPAGKTVKIGMQPDDGYHLYSLKINGVEHKNDATKEGKVYSYDLVMPGEAVSVEVAFERHDLRLTVEGGNGTLTADVPVMGVPAGTKITLTATPAFGYKLDTLKVNGEFVTVTGNTYVFNMPDVDHDVEVIATFDLPHSICLLSRRWMIMIWNCSSSRCTMTAKITARAGWSERARRALKLLQAGAFL